MTNYTVVHEFIKVTAGRFYTPSQIVRIASLVLGGNLIWQKKRKGRMAWYSHYARIV